MATIEVFEKAMCCATGVCGPAIDLDLARFAGDLQWFVQQGHTVKRANLGQNPGAFANHFIVRRILEESGDTEFPLVMIDDSVACKGRYPKRAELAHWIDERSQTKREYVGGVPHLVGIAVAFALGNGPGFRERYQQAVVDGVMTVDIFRAIATAQEVMDIDDAAKDQRIELLHGDALLS